VKQVLFFGAGASEVVRVFSIQASDHYSIGVGWSHTLALKDERCTSNVAEYSQERSSLFGCTLTTVLWLMSEQRPSAKERRGWSRGNSLAGGDSIAPLFSTGAVAILFVVGSYAHGQLLKAIFGCDSR
jgi:hypothetical protein